MKVIRLATLFTALVALTATSRSATAQGPLTPVTVLAFEAAEDDAAVAEELYDGLRAQIEFHNEYRLNDVPPQSLDDLLFAVGCTELDVSCASLVADIVGTEVLAWGYYDVGSVDATLTMVLFDLELATEVRTRSVTVPVAERSVLLQNHQVLSRALLYGDEGELTVEANIPGATVTLDGEPMGTAPVSIEDIPLGIYRVVVSADGHLPSESWIAVDIGGETATVALVEGTAPRTRTPREPRERSGGAGVGPYLVIGGGVALAVAGTVVGIQKNNTQDEFDEVLAEPVLDRDRAESLEDQGQRQAAMSNAFIIGGATLAVGGVVWAIVSSGKSDEAPTARPRVGGFASADGGGVDLGWRW